MIVTETNSYAVTEGNISLSAGVRGGGAQLRVQEMTWHASCRVWRTTTRCPQLWKATCATPCFAEYHTLNHF